MDTDTQVLSRNEVAQSIKSAQLELTYERVLHEAGRIYEEERIRQIRVQVLLLEHDHDEMESDAEKQEDTRRHLEYTNAELEAHLAEAEAELQLTQMDLKARLRDLDHMKTEINSLNAASASATRILAEKLELARELNTIKPELEHLRSQASASQKVLAEKLALQREVSSLQVELETEKRAVQRIKAREESASREDAVAAQENGSLRKELGKAQREMLNIKEAHEEVNAEIANLRKELLKVQTEAQAQAQAAHDDSALATEIGNLRKDLARAQRDSQKTERESRKKTTDWETEKEVLEGKLDAFRNKLRTTKDQLHEAQEEIEKLQASKMAQSAELTKARMNGAAPATLNPKKRNIARFDPDMTIGTPGNGGPAAKKPRVSVNVGDKSTFSITPFLNRTMSILPETPAEVEEEQQPEPKPDRIFGSQQLQELDQNPDTAAVPRDGPSGHDKIVSATKTVPTTNGRPLKALKTTAVKVKSTMKKSQLANLVEEDSDVESGKDGKATVNTSDKENSNHTTSLPAEKPLPSKRPNIFDDEGGAPAPKLRTLGGGGLGRISLKAKPVGKGKTLAQFSPLKKDRRAASIVE